MPAPTSPLGPSRSFTVAEANETIGRVRGRLSVILQLLPQLTILQRRFTEAGVVPTMELARGLGAAQGEVPTELVDDAARFNALIDVMNVELEGLRDEGCDLKDLETGLVDWPGRHQGRRILLCWKLGEERVEHWHDVDAGFAGRRPISELEP